MARPEENQPEQPPRRRATSADVAREAGVSRATVSYVLNRVPHQTIPESTRQLVLEAAQRLWSRPQVEHLAATGHRRIGYALPTDPRLRIFAEPRLAGVSEGCAELGLENPMVRVVGQDEVAAARAIEAWRAGPDPVTGVC